MSTKERFSYLLKLHTEGTLSNKEQEEFFELLSSSEYDAIVSNSIGQDLTDRVFEGSADIPPHIAQEIMRSIYTAEKNTAKILPLQKSRSKYIWAWVAAASIIFIAFSSYFLVKDPARFNEQSFIGFIPDSTVIQSNNTQHQQTVLLNDGSVITLHPHSSIHYPKQFDNDKREVYLEGEAFFQVAKNPQKPFLVYYNNIVTKVLGTSFTINTNPSTGNVEVAVRTGKVQVSENTRLVNGEKLNNSVIITPNQKAVYTVNRRMFETTLVEKPEPVIKEDVKQAIISSFIYEQEKLSIVLSNIELMYGIDIVVENTNLNNCVFTGDVSSQDLYNKLKIICLTLNATYEINGTKILIRGKGCN